MFNSNQPVNGMSAKHSHRPTVVCLVGIPGLGSTQVLLVLPKNAELHGWSLPQGEIHHGESPHQAALRELNEECGYQPAHFRPRETKSLYECANTVRGQMIKRYYVVGLRLREAIPPQLNGENRKFLYAAGPNCAWSHIGDCSLGKQRLIVASLLAAVSTGLLAGPRWSSERIEPLTSAVGGR